MQNPMIGVTPLFDRARDSYWMLPGYFLALEQAGAVPVMLPLTDDEALLACAVDRLDGVLMAGGPDVDPAYYGEREIPSVNDICPERDTSELTLLKLLWDADKPVFGICRGLQMMNVQRGGTLFQDLPTERPSDVSHRMKAPYDRVEHTVTVVKDSPLFSLCGAETIGVNSSHHQAIRTLSPDLNAMANSPDGLIEAIYAPAKRFYWAVQWHPERLWSKDENNRKLFQAFVNAAKEREERIGSNETVD